VPTRHPPVEGAWSGGQGPVARRLAVPLCEFLDAEAAANGLVLVAATTVGLLVANSAWSSGYPALWQTELAVEVGRWTLALVCGIGIGALAEGVSGRQVRAVAVLAGSASPCRCSSSAWQTRTPHSGTRPSRHPGRVGCSPPHLGAVLLLDKALPASARPESIPEEGDA
jgi:hypothetical protein